MASDMMADADARPVDSQRATALLVRDIMTGTQTLVRQELTLARLELVEGVQAKAKAAGGVGAAGVLALYVVGFLGLAGGSALANVVAQWLAWLIVAGAFLVVLLGLLLFAKVSAGSAPLTPERTKARIQEEVAWASRLLRR